MASNTAISNEHSARPRNPLRAGIYAPTMTFFKPDTEDLDTLTIEKHAVMLARAGLVGLVTMGSNGEAVHLSREEQAQVTRSTRQALDNAGYNHIPVIAGASSSSVRGTLLNINDARDAGAEYVLLLTPCYYKSLVDNDLIFDYFTSVADKSPLPIILYNFPGAVSGIDLDSDMIIRLAKASSNIIGAKFTCGNTGKLSRVASSLGASTSLAVKNKWMAFGGFADFTMQIAASAGSGIIAGGANVFPKMAVKVWDLWKQGRMQESIELNTVLADADWILTRTSIAGTKAAIEIAYGYGGLPRRPLKGLNADKRNELERLVIEYMKIENGL